MNDPAKKFGPDRAGEYLVQSRIALAGYEACHELSVCMLAAALGAGRPAHLLIAGAGGGAQEIITAGPAQPLWRFTAVDPSKPMMDISIDRLEEAGLIGRTQIRVGYVDDLALEQKYDAATLIGVLHHLPGDDAKRAVLKSIGVRLERGAPFVLAGNRQAYASQPLLLSAWAERWRMNGATSDEIEAKQGKILQGADPPRSDAAVAELLSEAGFERPTLFFASLFWGAWLAYRR